jgi:hypothetical protein
MMMLRNMLSERSHIQKTTQCIILFAIFRIGKSIKTESRLLITRGWNWDEVKGKG